MFGFQLLKKCVCGACVFFFYLPFVLIFLANYRIGTLGTSRSNGLLPGKIQITYLSKSNYSKNR